MSAVNFFYSQHLQHLNVLNSAHIVLIPKKMDAKKISDFRPISLTSSIAKILSKLLANRLSSCLSSIISKNQSAFIKKRSIHDNFLYTQILIRELYRLKRPSLFLKLDITKAFDTINWSYLLELLEVMGFGPKWRFWVTALLSTTSSSVLLNGAQGRKFFHKAGLRQGDPLSPMLFIIALEPLQALLALAEQESQLEPIHHSAAKIRVSLYADDAAVFLNPVKEDVKMALQILEVFGQASGLQVNLEKSAVYPIRCENLNMEEFLQPLGCQVSSFPCKYLGLPLSERRLKRVDIQPLFDKVAAKLPAWKGKLINRAGRLKLVNAVLTAVPIYFLTVFSLKKWAIKKLDKIRRSFLWKGTEDANGGHSLVTWRKASIPKHLGGAGILDLELLSRALRIRWLWFAWKEPDRPWVGMTPPCDETDRSLFRASTLVTIGDGCTAKFWHCPWLNGSAPRDLAPSLFKLAWRKNNCVREDLADHKWTRGLWRMSTVEQMAEFVGLWDAVQRVQFLDTPDVITWKWTANGIYSAKSAYNIQLLGTQGIFDGTSVWRAHAEGKHKFFAWLFVQGKILTADNLIRRNWPCNQLCPLCDQELETAVHLCLTCSFAKEVWFHVANWTTLDLRLMTGEVLDVKTWWEANLQHLPLKKQRSVAAVLMVTAWSIWNERNRRIFEQRSLNPLQVFNLIKNELLLRVTACGRPVLDLVPHVTSV